MGEKSFLVMRAARVPEVGSAQTVILTQSARMCSGEDETRAVAASGAWPGSVFVVWELDPGTSRQRALETARTVRWDRAVVLTDLGFLVDTSWDVVEDAEFVGGAP